VIVPSVGVLPKQDLAVILAESEREGWRFVRRLVDEWECGANRFDRPGEILFVARTGDSIIGICGLNIDPYLADDSVGRVRHLYVLRGNRRHGIGRRLVECVIEAAEPRFRMLRTRTENPDAARFYERLGFQRVNDIEHCTHILEILST
jgi:GNAT superfamily N-acetyltransferase